MAANTLKGGQKMKYVVIMIAVLTVGIINGLLRLPKKGDGKVVRPPMFFLIVGVLGAVGFLVPVFITVIKGEKSWVPIGFSVFSAIAVSIVIVYLNCRIVYDDEGFTVGNFFGIKKRYSYADVTGIEARQNEERIYIGEKVIAVDGCFHDVIEFVECVCQQYKKRHGGREIPNIRSTKGIFKGNVDDEVGAVAGIVIMAVLAVGVMIFAVKYMFFTNYTEANTESRQVIFESVSASGDDAILISSEGETYEIEYIAGSEVFEKIKSMCDGKAVLTVCVRGRTSEESGKYYSVKAVFHDGEWLFGFDDANRLRREHSKPVMIISSAIGVLFIAYIAGTIIVGRNPRKFGKKIVALFFKDGYIRY